MDDLISRQAAIDIVVFECGKWTGLAKEISKQLKQLSVDVVQVVHAHWIRHENADEIDGYEVPMFECSKCRAWKEDDSDYCPDCGAIMDGEE